jgi:hypothetical protein
MVTINPDKSISTIDAAALKKTQSNATTPAGEFDAILRKAVDVKDSSTAEAASTPFVSGIRPAQFTAETNPLPSPGMLVDQVEQLMDTMQAYQQKLGQSGVTLKEIQPLMERMTSQNERLGAIANTAGDQKQLGTLVDQSLMLSSGEIAKFNSGYYNDE